MRGAAVRKVLHVPRQAISAATQDTLAVPTSLSAEILKRQYSIYGVERIPPVGGVATALPRQEQVNSWAGISQSLGLDSSHAINLTGLWIVMWSNLLLAVTANHNEFTATWP